MSLTEGEYILMTMMTLFCVALVAIIFTAWMYRD
jgi:hypothetical protein